MKDDTYYKEKILATTGFRSVLGLFLVVMFGITSGCMHSQTMTVSEHTQAILDQATASSDKGKALPDKTLKRMSVLQQETNASIREMGKIMSQSIGSNASAGEPLVYIVAPSDDSSTQKVYGKCVRTCVCYPWGCGCCGTCAKMCWPTDR